MRDQGSNEGKTSVKGLKQGKIRQQEYIKCAKKGVISRPNINIDKTKVMIIKSKKDTYANFVYDNRKLEEVSSYKHLGIDIHHKLNWNFIIEKRINGGWKAYFGLENNCKLTSLVVRDKIISF